MRKTASAGAVLSALALTLAASDAKAGAFALYEQGVSGLGNAYAGQAAAAEDASTVWWNPAGMSWLPSGKHFSIALAQVEPSTQFSDTGSVAAAGRPLGNTGGDASHSATLWSLFFAMDAGRLSYGLGVNTPFGLKTEYDPAWLGRFQGISSQIKTININPAVAYRISDNLSLGGGLDYTTGEINLLSAVNLGLAEAQNRTNVKGDAWGFNIGVVSSFGPQSRVGVHYRASEKFKLDGDTSFSSPAPQTLNGKVKLDVSTPDSLAFSVAHRVSDSLQVLADATWWHWGKINQLPLIRTDGPQSGATLDTLILNLRDTWRLSAGANYKLAGPWTLKVGVAYDQTPVKGADTRTVRLPDSDRYWLSAGVKFALSKSDAFDAGYTYIKAQNADINNDQSALGRGIVRGTYDAKVHIFGFQYQHTF